MPAIDSLTVQGFKSIASLESLPLRPINVVIGANGSGKSNFIGVFSLLHAIRAGRLRDYVVKAGGAEKVLHFGSKVTQSLRVHIAFETEQDEYDIELLPTDNDELVPRLERASPADGGDVPARVAAHFDRWRLYHFHDTSSGSPMKKTADVDDNRYFRADGANLAAFLYFLRQRHDDCYRLIRQAVRRVTPFFDDFRLEPQQLNPNKIKLEWRHTGSDAYFDAASLSDGTLRFIALATLFLQPETQRPSVILIDEPELGLHPYAITLLASLIKQAAFKTQVVVSTQSSLLLDHFQPEDVLVAERKHGGTQLTRLNSTKLATWLEDYSLGQLWEKNEFGGRPEPE